MSLAWRQVLSTTPAKGLRFPRRSDIKALMSSQAPAKTPVVMKFGGSSVADLEAMQRVASIVAQRAKLQPVVVVVSAMGKTTNRLVQEAKTLHANPSLREMDMLLTTGERHSMALLAIAISAQGQDACSLTGSQCGILTTHRHGDAQVMEARPFRIQDELHAGKVVVVGGFQGVSYQREVTTLGRGGSDTSAVVLAAALGADCELYSDVDGVYTADPRVVSDATHLASLSHDEMLALSRAGARVLHATAVAYAKAHDVVIYAKSTRDPQGRHTRIGPNSPSASVLAVAHDAQLARIELRSLQPLSAESITMLMGGLGPLELRFFEVTPHGARGYLSLGSRDDASNIEVKIGELTHALSESHRVQWTDIEVDQSLAQVSCIGSRNAHPVFSRLEGLAREQNLDLHAVFSDSDAVHTIFPARDLERWLRVVHNATVTQ